MDLAGAFSFVLHIDFGFQTFLYMSIILVGVALLLTFSILLALKYDGLISIPWPNVFAPLYVFLIVFVFPCCCAFSLGHHNTKGSPPPSSEHLELDTRENKEHQPGYRKYFYWLIFFSFVAFSILYPLHYEKGFPESWIGSFSPLIITMVALLLLKITSLYKTIEAGPAAEFEDPKNDSGLKLDTHEEGEPGPQKPAKYSVREKIILTLGKYTTPLFTLQIILAAFKLDQYFGDTSWKIIFVPSWAWAVIGLVLVVLESMTPSLYSPGISNGSVKLSNTNIFFIVLVPNLLLLLVNSAFFYPVIVMLQYRLDNPNSAYYQARQILAPIFALFALLMIITIACPIIAVMLRKYLLRKFGKSYSTGNYQRQTTAGLITASSNP